MIISVIIPCFNEEQVIQTTLDRMNNVLLNINEDYEIICINDGSSDKTLDLLKQNSQSNQNIKIINFSRNFGHQPAVTAGIKECYRGLLFNN